MNLNDFLQLNKILPIDGDGCINLFGIRMHTDDLLILALLFFYKLDREYDGIMKVLDERHKKQEEAAA